MLYVLLAVLAGIVVPALSVTFSVNAFRTYQVHRRQADIESLGESLTELYDEEGGIWKRQRVMDVLRPAPQWFGMVITLLDEKGEEVFTLRARPPMHHRGLASDDFPPQESLPPRHEPGQFEHITLLLGRDRAKPIGRLEIERRIPTGRYEISFITYLTRYTLYGALIMVVVACGLGYYVAGRLSRPVIRAIDRTKHIARGEYDSQETFSPIGIRELDALTRGVEDLGRSLAGQEKLRRRLMVDVAHELRTPLTVTRTQIEAIADGILEPTPERLTLCVNEMERLADLIGNIDALTRLEAETLAIHTERTDMKSFLEPVIESFGPVFDKAGITLTANLGGNCACEIDRDNFRHIIDNLLSNALRYTNPQGRVNVKLFRQGKNITIEVSDTGIGISEKDLPNIFERFYRADESRARVTGGSGVGLAIVKASVEAHGGSITVESEKGKGSTFRIMLPMSV